MAIVTATVSQILYPGGEGDPVSIDYGDGPQDAPRADVISNAQNFADGVHMEQQLKDMFAAIWYALDPTLANANLIEGKTLVYNPGDPNGHIVKLVDAE